MIVRFFSRAAGALCLVFAIIPFAFYGILNTGVGAFGLTGLALTLLPSLWKTRLAGYPRLRGLILAAGAIGLAFCVIVSVFIARRAWFTPPPDSGKFAVIVLGSKIHGDQPSLMLRRRLDVAAEYLERNPEAVCVVSGGQGPDEEYPEAYVMRKYLIETGTDSERILMEDQSTNTRQNLRYSIALLEDGAGAVIATDGFHQMRASMYAADEGLETTYNISSLTPWGLLPTYWMREILGLSWAWVLIRFGIQ